METVETGQETGTDGKFPDTAAPVSSEPCYAGGWPTD
jgi:hypothetical protein